MVLIHETEEPIENVDNSSKLRIFVHQAPLHVPNEVGSVDFMKF